MDIEALAEILGEVLTALDGFVQAFRQTRNTPDVGHLETQVAQLKERHAAIVNGSKDEPAA